MQCNTSTIRTKPNARKNTIGAFPTRSSWKFLPRYAGGLVVLALLTLSGNHARADVDATKLENGVDEIVTEIQAELNVLPGFSIAVVRGEEVLFTKAYGVASITSGTPFTPDTLSYIASGTKAFVGLAVAQLMERGELDLDNPVGPTYLADIDPETLGPFGETTLRELLTHTHGLDGESIEIRTAYTGDIAETWIWALLGQLPAAESGKTFSYSNFGYVATSYVLEHAFGETWQNLVERIVLAPAGMSNTTFKVSDLVDSTPAQPHQWRGETLQVPLYKRDNTMHAAGGNFTNIRDLSRWLRLNLNGGKIDGEQVWSESAVALSLSPLAEVNSKFYEYTREAYGLGWYVSDYHGETLYHHFGSFTGYRAHISMMPKTGIGVAILANDFSPPTFYLPDMLASYIYDVSLDKENPEKKYLEQITDIAEQMAPHAGKPIPERPRNAPAEELAMAGLYENPKWGVWELRPRGTKLRLHWGNVNSDLSYSIREGEPYIRFELAGNGYLARIEKDSEGNVTALVFRGDALVKRDTLANPASRVRGKTPLPD